MNTARLAQTRTRMPRNHGQNGDPAAMALAANDATTTGKPKMNSSPKTVCHRPVVEPCSRGVVMGSATKNAAPK